MPDWMSRERRLVIESLGATSAIVVPMVARRRTLGAGKLIGVSCYDRLELARAAAEQGADYVAFGSFFPSPVKPGAVQAPLALLAAEFFIPSGGIILVIALLILGPGKLPDVGSALGKSIREFRKAATDVQEATRLDAPSPSAAPPATSACWKKSTAARSNGW